MDRLTVNGFIHLFKSFYPKPKQNAQKTGKDQNSLSLADHAYSKRSEYQGLGISGFHKVSYQDWENRSSSLFTRDKHLPLICVHGLTRNSHDFDKIAFHLSANRRVVCPDIVGRGQSDWIANSALYEYLQYNADMNALISRVNSHQIDWLGTSMGGLIGMMLAASANSPIRKLILNDVGPYIPYAALSKIGDYVGRSPEFEDLNEAEDYLRHIHQEFVPMTDDDWKEMTRTGVRELDNGKLALNYDPGIGDPVRAGLTGIDVNLWGLWEMIDCPVLVFRGENSKLLTPSIAERMQETGPKATLIEIPGAGHAPTLNIPSQIKMISDWLNE
jgi:pimeloyl-ACP methyl ester carboxylesterase